MTFLSYYINYIPLQDSLTTPSPESPGSAPLIANNDPINNRCVGVTPPGSGSGASIRYLIYLISIYSQEIWARAVCARPIF